MYIGPIADVTDFIRAAAAEKTNLWRIGADGIPHATDTVVTYTGGAFVGPDGQVAREGDLRIHPQVAGLVDDEMRGKMMDSGKGPAA
jgi:hypothetical protein